MYRTNPFIRFTETPPENGEKPNEGGSGGKAPEGEKKPPWGDKPENFDPDQAWELIQNLRKEKGSDRTELEKQIADLKKAGDDQRDALAKALGVKPEETSDTDKLSAQISDLTEQFTKAQRENQVLKVMAAPGVDGEGKPLPAIPEEYRHLLTATEPEALAAQAKSVAELVVAKGGAQQTPNFAQSNGQGQGGGNQPPLPQQIASAERELAGKTPGTPEHREAMTKVTNLKTQQLAGLKPQ